MADRHPGGYLKVGRAPIGYRDRVERIGDYEEIFRPRWEPEAVAAQGGRCMDCGVPACMGGCPLGNLIPEWNDLVSRSQWREALTRLHATNNFPEFTGYTCPAPCEPACVLAINQGAVTIKSIERAIVDKGWAEGWIVPEPPAGRSGYAVAVVGSGPAGLAAAQQLNRAGHSVTVFERDDALGGLMTYGIPDFKFAKHRVTRRIEQLTAEGVRFQTRVNVGVDVPLARLRADYDAVCLTVGALAPRDLDLPGRTLSGVALAMPYLVGENRFQAGREPARGIDARGARVVVLGGGDTGADCVATAHRQGAASVTQVDINTRRPDVRPPDNPWPEPPVTFERTYAQEEGDDGRYGFEALEFTGDGAGRVAAVRGQGVIWRYDARRRRLERTIVEREQRVPADLVLIAVGFAGPELAPFADERFELRANGTPALRDDMQTSVPGVFAAGDANLGATTVVWAIAEGRDVARAIDLHLTGETRLPPSIRTANPPLS